MKLYYGADRLFYKPIYGFGNPTNDYGLGFYLTPDKEMARLWASKNKNGGYLMTFNVDINKLNVLRLAKISKDDILKWISILVSHRFSKDEIASYKKEIAWLRENYPINLNNVDMIVGYRADDSYFQYSRDFVANELSLNLLSDALEAGHLGFQYVLISKKAFELIELIDCEEVPHSDEYEIFRNKVDSEYQKLKKEDDINNTFIRDLMRGKNNGNS